MTRLHRLALRTFLVAGTVAGWSMLAPAPFTMRVVDEHGHGVAGVRIVTDNGIVCFTRLDGQVSWAEWSLLRRTVTLDMRDDWQRYADAAARLPFTPGGHGMVAMQHLTSPKS
jgi:hypothetical protein